MSALAFELEPDLEAHEPPEARGLPRDGVLQAATTLANAQDQNIGFVTRG